MSLAALCQATRDALLTAFKLTESSCQVKFDGQPDPDAGELFLAIHPLGWNAVDGDYDLHEGYQVGVTLTMRTAVAPKDRRGVALWLPQDGGLDSLCRLAIKTIHQSQAVRAAANDIAKSDNAIFKPLFFRSVSLPTPRNADWFSADAEKATDRDCGVSQTITFGNCERGESISDMANEDDD